MFSKIQFLETCAKKNSEELAERRALFDSIAKLKGEPTQAERKAAASNAASSAASMDQLSSSVPSHGSGILHGSKSSPALLMDVHSSPSSSLVSHRRPAERTGFASPPGTPLLRKMRTLVVSVSKNADELAYRRAIIDSFRSKSEVDEDGPNNTVQGLPRVPSAASHDSRRKQPVYDFERNCQKYYNPMNVPASVKKEFPPPMLRSPSTPMLSRCETLEHRAMWNAQRLAQHRTMLNDVQVF